MFLIFNFNVSLTAQSYLSTMPSFEAGFEPAAFRPWIQCLQHSATCSRVTYLTTKWAWHRARHFKSLPLCDKPGDKLTVLYLRQQWYIVLSLLIITILKSRRIMRLTPFFFVCFFCFLGTLAAWVQNNFLCSLEFGSGKLLPLQPSQFQFSLATPALPVSVQFNRA